MHIDYDRPQLYPKQFAAVFDKRRYSLIEASTKSGKTHGCLVWLFEQALRGRVGWNYWWVAPVAAQSDIAFRRLREWIPEDMRNVGLSGKTITLYNGSRITFKSADKPDTLYGDDVYACVIDEASRMKEDSFHAVRSTLTKTEGPIRIIGNVKGRRNWFYAMARRAQEGDPAMGYHRIVAGDAVAAGVLRDEEIEDARRTLPDHIFRELYLAEASEDEGNPFGHLHIKACVSSISVGSPICWGWDLAKSVDWTVGIALDADCRVCRFVRYQNIPWHESLNRIRQATGRVPALVDSTGLGDTILESLQRGERGSKFIGFHFTGPSKQKLMEGLAVAIQSKQVAYPEGAIVLELNEFTYEYTKTGVHYEAREGCHDDCVCALALALWHYKEALRDRRYAMMEWVTKDVY